MPRETLIGSSFGSTAAADQDRNDIFLVAGTYNAITLDGGNNTVVSDVVLSHSTVTISLSGTIGGNLVILDNVAGSNTVTAGGPNNSITLNPDATDTVTAGSGFDVVVLGSPATPLGAGFISTVALSGDGSIVEAGEQNLAVDPGADNNTVDAGNGNDSVALSGSGNMVELGNGTDSVSIAGSNNAVYFELVGPSPTATTDSFSSGGDFNLVVEASALARNTVTVTIAGTIGANVVLLGNGNDIVKVGGIDNFVELGNGNDSVSLPGPGFNFAQVGGGQDTVTMDGNGNAIYVNLYNLIATDSVTATGDSNGIFIGGSGTATSGTLNLGGGSGDFVSLGIGSFKIIGYGGNNAISAADTAASSDSIDLGSGNADEIGVGAGSDTIIDNGNGNEIVGGSGNDLINASGNSNGIILGNGNNVLNLGGNGNNLGIGIGNNTIDGGNGNNNVVSAADAPHTTNVYNFGTGTGNFLLLGDGNDTVTDSGNNVAVFTGNGNDVINADGNAVAIGLGSGNNVLSATGIGDAITIAGAANSSDTLTVGSNSGGSIGGGTLDLDIGGNTQAVGDSFTLDGLALASTVDVNGNNNLMQFIDGASGTVNLGNNVGSDIIEIKGSSGTYDGTLTIDNFRSNDSNGAIYFETLTGAVDHNPLNSLAEIAANSTILSGSTLEILLQNRGTILLPLVTSLNASNAAFG